MLIIRCVCAHCVYVRICFVHLYMYVVVFCYLHHVDIVIMFVDCCLLFPLCGRVVVVLVL